MMIFIVVISLYYLKIAGGISDQESYSEKIREATKWSSELLGEGIPSNWTAASAIRIGIGDTHHRINISKLTSFANMSYTDMRSVVNVPFDFFIFFSDSRGCIINVSTAYGIGNPAVGFSTPQATPCAHPSAKNVSVTMDGISVKELAVVKRLVIYDSQITTMVVYVW